MSKTIQRYIDKHPDKFASWHREPNIDGANGRDYWVYCKSPYFSPDMETQTIHEANVKETLEKMRGVIKGRYNGYCWE